MATAVLIAACATGGGGGKTTFGNNACTDCCQGECDAAIDACNDIPGCEAQLECVFDCPLSDSSSAVVPDGDCASECPQADTQEGEDAFFDVISCLLSHQGNDDTCAGSCD